MTTKITWALSGFIAFVFAQSLVFKFSGAAETVIIFSTIADWMSSIGLQKLIVETFRNHGAYAVATTELIAAALILLPKTRKIGAKLSLAVISGAIFFHLFTPLGINRVVDAAGNTDGGALFFTALAVAVSSLLVLWLTKSKQDNNLHFKTQTA